MAFLLLHAAAALLAIRVLFRNAPRAIAAARGRRPEDRAGALVPLVNVALGLVVLAVAVKGLATSLISR